MESIKKPGFPISIPAYYFCCCRNLIKGVGPAGSDQSGYAISDSQFGDHIHFEVHRGGKSINLGRMVTQAWKIPTYGLEQGQAEIKWSTDIDIGGQGGAYVNEVEKLIFFRDPAITANSQTDYWLAWEPDLPIHEMKRVGWISKLDDGTIINSWLKADNFSIKWNPIIRKFEDR